MKKFLLISCVALAAPAFAQTPTPTTNPPSTRLETRDVKPFPDVPPGHWAASAVETLHRAGIVKGYPATAKPAPRVQTAKRLVKTVKH